MNEEKSLHQRWEAASHLTQEYVGTPIEERPVVGMRVGIRHREKLRVAFRPGIIKSIDNDGLVVVQFDDGDVSEPMSQNNFYKLGNPR